MKMPHLDVEIQTEGKNREIKKHLSNIIDDISDAKQLSAKQFAISRLILICLWFVPFRLAGEISDICQYIIVTAFLWTLANISSTLMLMDFDLV